MRRFSAVLVAIVVGAFLLTPSARAEESETSAAPQFAEQWEDLKAWRDVGVQVDDGRLYGSASPATGAYRSVRVPVGEDFRLRTSIVLDSGGTGAGLTAAGFATAPKGAYPSGSGLITIGFNEAGQPVLYRGEAAGGSGLTVLSPDPQPDGRYSVTVSTDESGVLLAMTNSDGSSEWRTAIRWSTIPAPLTKVAVWNSDARGLSGTAVGPLGYRSSARPITVGTGIEDRAPSVTWTWGPDDTVLHVALPPGYDGSEPLPLVVYAHGSMGSELSVLEPDTVKLYTALLDAGYAVASSSQHGNNWGTEASVDDIRSLYDYVSDRYPVDQVFLLGHSMGGLSSLQAAADPDLPVAAWAGIYPVTNLKAVWDDARFTQTLVDLYGTTTWTDALADHDPNRIRPEEFDGLGMRFYASPEDTVVDEDQHSRLLATRLKGYAEETTVVPHVGEHGDPSAYDAEDLVAFFDDYRD